MKKRLVWIIGGIILIAFISFEVFQIRSFFRQRCPFYRQGKCIACSDSVDIPVGLKENCNRCPTRTAVYIGDGTVPAWICQSVDAYTRISGSEMKSVDMPSMPCPDDRPLKDLVGNCYACNTQEPVRVAHWSRAKMCLGKRYFTPHILSEKSVLCPQLSSVSNPEMCDMCGGGWIQDHCAAGQTSRYCVTNSECQENEWCYPFMIEREQKTGICAKRDLNKKWSCSTTDGYSRSAAERFCAQQGGRIPSLDDLTHDKQGAMAACPHNDMWTFFDNDGAMYMAYLDKEFVITRDGEVGDYGQADFFALCIID